MIYTIYMHKNTKNGKVYIGQTIQKPEDRWKNGYGYKTCTLFYNAIKKYGWDNFEHIILAQEEMTQQEADEKESYYIDLYHSRDLNYGYNINDGGYRTISPNAEPAAIKWMQEHPEFGLARAQDMLKWQKEHPGEMLKMRKENIKKAITARKRAVLCIETGEVFESAAAAARIIPKTSQSKICMVCRGQRITCGGFHWKYIEEE